MAFVRTFKFDTGASCCLVYNRQGIDWNKIKHFVYGTSKTAAGAMNCLFVNDAMNIGIMGLKLRKGKFSIPLDSAMIWEIFRNKTNSTYEYWPDDMFKYLNSSNQPLLKAWLGKSSYEAPDKDVAFNLNKFGVSTTDAVVRTYDGLLGHSYLKNIFYFHSPLGNISCFDHVDDFETAVNDKIAEIRSKK
jgi:hypothetical protein